MKSIDLLKKFTLLLLLLQLLSCASFGERKEQRLSEQEEWKLLENKVMAALKGKQKGYLEDELFVKAVDASLRGESERAVRLYGLLGSMTKSDYVEKKYAIELIRAGELQKALPYLGRSFRRGQEAGVGLILGGVYVALGEFKKARKIYRRILKKEPGHQEACVFLAKSYVGQERFKKAHRELAQCYRVAKSSYFTYYRGRIELERKHYRAAERFFRKTLKKDADFYQAALGLGMIYEKAEKFKKAQLEYQYYLNHSGDKDNYAILVKLVQVMLARGETETVIPYMEMVSELDQSDLNLKVKLGILYTDAGKFRLAKGVFEEILYEQPGSDKVLYYLGSLCQHLGESEEAIEYFSKIEADSNLHADGMIQVAQMLSALAVKDYLSRQKSNIARFEAFLEQQGRVDDLARVEFAIIEASYYEAIENIDQAIAVVQKISHLKDFSEDHGYYLVSLLDRADRTHEAMQIMKNMVAKNPENADALNYIGYSLVERGDRLDEAYGFIMRALKIRPDDGYIRDSLGWYYYKVGEYQKALKEVQRAWELVGTDVVITKHLGLIYKELKKYSSAKKFYRKALKQCTREDERQDILQELQELEQVGRLPASSP